MSLVPCPWSNVPGSTSLLRCPSFMLQFGTKTPQMNDYLTRVKSSVSIGVKTANIFVQSGVLVKDAWEECLNYFLKMKFDSDVFLSEPIFGEQAKLCYDIRVCTNCQHFSKHVTWKAPITAINIDMQDDYNLTRTPSSMLGESYNWYVCVHIASTLKRGCGYERHSDFNYLLLPARLPTCPSARLPVRTSVHPPNFRTKLKN